ncbi:helix-turn-helix domain-containing protein [Enterococcus gilvus]|uniref:helix-turn-helix domain-containing protein n=1 Tax=Enterococcus gilvus TaxID=160453 RepID=UPI0028D17D19|nr:helix-turn-helix domain-containing protein [Enterococcus gilvus]
MNILLITHYPLYNTDFVDSLTALGYETFCSENSIEQLRNKRNVIYLSKIFQIIMFDSTISNSYIEEVMPSIRGNFAYVTRKNSKPANSKLNKNLRELGVDYVFNNSTDIDELRDELSKVDINQSVNITEINQLTLTITEEKIFNYLLENSDRIVSRTELCKLIWQETGTASHYSSISNSIRSIRTKLDEINLRNSILTFWKKGYKLNSAFNKFYKEYSTE